jgi:sulfite reductase beta subunit-like hemoprotein
MGVVVGLPNRRLPAAGAAALVGLALAAEFRVTPWRSLLVPWLTYAGADAVLSWARKHNLEVGGQ